MASLVESGVKNLNFGDADSVGFFQMRVGIWNQGAYKGYPRAPGAAGEVVHRPGARRQEAGDRRAATPTSARTRRSGASGSPTSSAPPSSTAAATSCASRRRAGCSAEPAATPNGPAGCPRPGRSCSGRCGASRPRRRRRPGSRRFGFWVLGVGASASAALRGCGLWWSSLCRRRRVRVRRRRVVRRRRRVVRAALTVFFFFLAGALALGLEGRQRAADLDAGHRRRGRDLDALRPSRRRRRSRSSSHPTWPCRTRPRTRRRRRRGRWRLNGFPCLGALLSRAPRAV